MRRCGLLVGRGLVPRFSRPVSLPRATRSPSGFPKEHLGRRPPPSTSFPCRAWFCRCRRPLFSGSETPVDKTLAPVQLAARIQFGQEASPHFEPDIVLLPQVQSAPARGRADPKVRG